MIITRHNYEEYFILYLDNELTAEERLQVEKFASLHPDLKEELEMLLLTRVVPDQKITFRGKSELMKFENEPGSINLSSYEEWLVLYVDNELTAREREDVENFVAQNPVAQKELSLLTISKLQPEEVVFPNKELLHRREEKVRRFPVWLRISAAAAIIIAVGTTSIILLNGDKKTGEGIAQGKTTATAIAKDNLAGNTPLTTPNNNTLSSTIQEPTVALPKENNVATVVEARKEIKQSNSAAAIPAFEKEASLIAEVKNSNGNNLPLPSENPYVNPEVNKLNSIAGNVTAQETLTSNPEIEPTVPVTIGSSHAYNVGVKDIITDPGGEEDESSGKKNKLRGFFRKVTRTFEKRTNIDPTDGDERLLVGGLSIKLK